MSVKTIIFVFLVLLEFLNVESVDDFAKSGNSQSFTSQQPYQIQNEETFKASHQQELQQILKYLEKNRKYEDDFRKRESSIQGQLTKEQRFNDQLKIDKLELKMREQIEYFLDFYARRQPMDEVYLQKFNALNRDLIEMKESIRRIEEWRVQEVRVHDQRQIQYYQQQLNARREFEQKLSVLEMPPKDSTAKMQRTTEQKVLQDIEKSLQDNLLRLQNWHSKNQPLNNEYNKLTSEIKKNCEGFTFITNQIDQRRVQERLAESQNIFKLKANLDLKLRYEHDQRKQEQPTNNEMLALQRIKDELEEDHIYQAIRQRLIIIEKRLEQNIPLDKEYAYHSDILNRDLNKLYKHLESVQQRRTQVHNVQAMQRSKGSECFNVRFCGKPQ